MLDITKVPLDDTKVWDMIQEGKVKGCFQIESPLGRHWCKKVKPRSIKELSDLVSIVRPGVLKFIYDGKSMTQHYADRKHGLEPATPLHPALNDLLKDTHQIIVYQEQILSIVRKIAGFNDGQANNLRKGVGKKQADLVAKARVEFIEGCQKVGLVNKEEAELIFDNIEKSARYSFVRAHATSYAILSYWSAYLKCYYPHKYYLNWLRLADEKIDPDKEMRELILSAKNDGIVVKGPSIKLMNENFEIDNGIIHFGFCNVKNVGKLEFEKMKSRLQGVNMDWDQLMVFHLLDFNKRVVDNLVYTGVFEGKPRLQFIHELSCMRELTEKEVEWLRSNWGGNLRENLRRLAYPKKEGGGAANKNRSQLILDIINRLDNPGRDLNDNPAVLSKIEKELLGCEISFSELDNCRDATFANCTCEQFLKRDHSKFVIFAATIKSYREIETKNNEQMCFLTIEDKTAELENIIVFPNIYAEYGDIIYEGATVLISGQRSNKGDDSFIVEKIESI